MGLFNLPWSGPSSVGDLLECQALFTLHQGFYDYTLPGAKEGETFNRLWQGAEIIDLELDKAYRAFGVADVNHALQESDSLEHLLSDLGAELALLHTGDVRMYQELLSCKPPGAADILPSWKLAQARDASKALYQQNQRANRTATSSDAGGGAGRHVLAKAKAKAKAKPKTK